MSEARKEILSLEEAADVLKVGVPTVEDLIADGSLAAHDEAGVTCVRYDDLVAYLRISHRASSEDGDPPAAGKSTGVS